MKRILFVDDDPHLLDGLRARLRSLRSNWEMVFVESGERALAELEYRPVDVIVSDMRMPVMDGAQLLQAVADRWPQTVRVVLSGFVAEEETTRLLPLAHRHISKPCDIAELVETIERCCQLHALLALPRLQAIVGGLRKLPAVPQVYLRLRTATTREDVSAGEIADIIQDDPAIAAKVLQIVNSSFYRSARRMSRVDHAVSYLGLTAVRNIVLSAEVFAQWPRHATIDEFSADGLQRQAQQLAATARALAAGTAVADDALVAGLLHNIGYRVLVQECWSDLELVIRTARARDLPLHAAELEVIGCTHAEIGAYLLGLWGLPAAIVEAVAFQYSPQRIIHARFDATAAVAIAHSLQPTLLAASPADTSRPEIDAMLKSLHAPFDWNEARRKTAAAVGNGDS